jgi:hypothetical protein
MRAAGKAAIPSYWVAGGYFLADGLQPCNGRPWPRGGRRGREVLKSRRGALQCAPPRSPQAERPGGFPGSPLTGIDAGC